MTDASPEISPESRALAHGAPRAAEIIAFWRDAGPKRWFAKSDAFDDLIRRRFAARVEAAREGALDDWTATPDGALGLVILLDQFPRNLYRDTPSMFASDAKARDVADAAIEAGFDQAFARDMRQFLYLPFMHSEETADQRRALALYEALGQEESLRFARIHAEAIERFGRFPHRNAILGRETTAEERAYLDEGGFAG